MTSDKELIHHIGKTTDHRAMNKAIRSVGGYLFIYIP
jgi:hypothetical protein